MGSSNSGSERKHFLRWIVCRVQGGLRGRQQPPHDGSSREELPVWTPHSAANSGAPHQAEWLSPRPGRDVPARPCFGRKPQIRSYCSSRRPVEHLARPQHRMHRNSQPPCDSDGRTFETNALPQFKPPCAQRAVG